MKTVAHASPTWPETLEDLRALCKFWRNGSYRLHVSRRLRDKVPGVKKLLRFFTATFAKWRYETLDNVLKQLLPLRRICEEEFDVAMFSQAQDPEFIRSVDKACKNKRLWRWMEAASKYLFHPLESVRRWGMVCECPEHVALRKQHKGKSFTCLRTMIH